MSPAEENAYLVKGSQLFNAHDFYAGHDEWEEVWRRASGTRRRLLHGLIQVAVGYEHLKRGNPRGMRSLLGQGAAKLRYFTRRTGVSELRNRALADAERASAALSSGPSGPELSLRTCPPPKILIAIEGESARRPARAIEIRVPAP